MTYFHIQELRYYSSSYYRNIPFKTTQYGLFWFQFCSNYNCYDYSSKKLLVN